MGNKFTAPTYCQVPNGSQSNALVCKRYGKPAFDIPIGQINNDVIDVSRGLQPVFTMRVSLKPNETVPILAFQMPTISNVKQPIVGEFRGLPEGGYGFTYSIETSNGTRVSGPHPIEGFVPKPVSIKSGDFIIVYANGPIGESLSFPLSPTTSTWTPLRKIWYCSQNSTLSSGSPIVNPPVTAAQGQLIKQTCVSIR